MFTQLSFVFSIHVYTPDFIINNIIWLSNEYWYYILMVYTCIWRKKTSVITSKYPFYTGIHYKYYKRNLKLFFEIIFFYTKLNSSYIGMLHYKLLFYYIVLVQVYILPNGFILTQMKTSNVNTVILCHVRTITLDGLF